MSIKKIAIVSLSSGILGEEYIQHEVKLGLERLRNYNIDVKFMDNSLKGIDFLNKHPEARAEDLIEAFSDDTIDILQMVTRYESPHPPIPADICSHPFSPQT